MGPRVLTPGYTRNRLGLARWLVDPAHPLTARVAVNRYWQQYLGRGIVKTTEDFDAQGEWPTHPELLDWLAVEFIDSGWNIKHIQRLIVMSASYLVRGSAGHCRDRAVANLPSPVKLAARLARPIGGPAGNCRRTDTKLDLRTFRVTRTVRSWIPATVVLTNTIRTMTIALGPRPMIVCPYASG